MTRQVKTLSFNCNVLQDQVKAMLSHSIEKDAFDKIVKDFFGVAPTDNPADLPTNSYSLPYVTGQVNHPSRVCTDFIDFNDADMNILDNGDVTFKLNAPGAPMGSLSYSIALFRGIIGVFAPVQFEFYKAKADYGYTIAFRTKLSTNEILYWDVSIRQPLFFI